jgi:hypothetical protein
MRVSVSMLPRHGSLLHEVWAQAPSYFGILKGQDEIVILFKKGILLKFTRSVSNLLLASRSFSSELSLLPFQLKTCRQDDSQELKPMPLTGYENILLCFLCSF